MHLSLADLAIIGGVGAIVYLVIRNVVHVTTGDDILSHLLDRRIKPVPPMPKVKQRRETTSIEEAIE